jgi:hypothetical protein
VHRFVIASLLIAVSFGGCMSDDDPPARPDKPLDVSRFDNFQVVWLGREFEGMKAGAITKEGRYVHMSYGPCVKVDSGCSTTFDIVVEPTPDAGSLEDLKKFHGIPGTLEDDAGDTLLRLYARRMRVTISGRKRRQVIRAAGALRPLTDPPMGKPRMFRSHPWAGARCGS